MEIKKLLLSLIILFPALSVSAEDINAVILHLASGKEVTCYMENEPLVTFNDEDIVIKTTRGTLTYSSADVLKFTYGWADPAQRINSLQNSGVIYSLESNVLKAWNLKANEAVTAYTADGREVSRATASAIGYAQITLPTAPGTVYLIKTSDTNFKIILP